MVDKIKKAFIKLVKKLKNSVERFPETIIITVVFVVMAIYTNHSTNEAIENILMALILGMPISATIVLLVERYGWKLNWRFLLDAILVIGLLLFYLMIPETLGQKFMVRYASAIVVFCLLFTLVPYYFRRRTYAIYCIKLLTSFLVTYLYTFVLFAGISAMIFTVDQLFNLELNGEIYADLLIITTGFFGVTYFLGSIPFVRSEMTLEDYPKVFKVLFVSIVMPLLTAYTVILYAYFIKILFNRSWPDGLVGNLVLWYGWIAIIILFCIFDFGEKKTWTGFFKRIFPIAFIVPLGMLISTIWIRTNNYGLTVLRYYVWMAALWFLIVVIYLIINKRLYSTFVIVSLIVFILISAFGPMNGFEMSIRSQNNRLEKLLIKNDMLANGQIVKDASLPEDEKEKINSILNYMNNIEAINRVKYVPEDFELKDTKAIFGFPYLFVDGWEQEHYNYYFDNFNTIVDTSKYEYIINFFISEGQMPYEINNDSLSIQFTEEKMLSISYKNEIILKENLGEVIFSLHEKLQNKTVSSQDELSYTFKTEKATIVLELNNLYGSIVDNNEAQIDSIQGKIWVDIH
ncbi:MAG: hypothetical protein CVU84_13100 [Firmicutes bacterium HGW-Firmicutes-1]|jgi:hypothetical protein|nr:MAG: hypothetical protein CVU84_13100 [Firmicutes bacterium HGW-Firmicutes-1]